MRNDTMTTDTLFTKKIAKVRQRVFFKQVCRFALIALCLFLLLHGLVLAAEKTGAFRFERETLLYALLTAMALLMAALAGFIHKRTLLQVLIEIDSRFGLHDRLSTAYEYHLNDKTSIFSASLLDDASRSLERFTLRKLLPLHLSRLFTALVLVALFNVLLLFVDAPQAELTSALRPPTTKEEQKKNAAQTPKQQKQKDEKLQEKEEREAGYERLKEKAEELRQQSLSPQERAKQLQEMLQEVQGIRETLMDSSQVEPGAATLENLSIRQLPLQQRMMSSSLERLEKGLQNMLSENASGAFEDSQELPSELREQLSEFMKDLDELQTDSAQDEQEQGDDGNAENSETASAADSEGQQGRREQGDEGIGGGNDGKSGVGEQVEGMKESGQGGNMNDPGRTGNDGSRAAVGRGPGDGEEYPPSLPETSENPIRQDRVRSLGAEQYNVHIRSVTEIGKANLPEEDLTRPYRREVESVLQQEEMPLNYREYIKNYFLSIGLTEE